MQWRKHYDVLTGINPFQCAEKVGLDASKIDTCANEAEGHQLLYEAGERTHSLNPALFWVPWIVLDGVSLL